LISRIDANMYIKVYLVYRAINRNFYYLKYVSV